MRRRTSAIIRPCVEIRPLLLLLLPLVFSLTLVVAFFVPLVVSSGTREISMKRYFSGPDRLVRFNVSRVASLSHGIYTLGVELRGDFGLESEFVGFRVGGVYIGSVGEEFAPGNQGDCLSVPIFGSLRAPWTGEGHFIVEAMLSPLVEAFCEENSIKLTISDIWSSQPVVGRDVTLITSARIDFSSTAAFGVFFVSNLLRFPQWMYVTCIGDLGKPKEFCRIHMNRQFLADIARKASADCFQFGHQHISRIGADTVSAAGTIEFAYALSQGVDFFCGYDRIMVQFAGSTSITWDMLFSKSISLDSLWIVRPIFQYSLSLESPMYTFTKSSIIVNSLPSGVFFSIRLVGSENSTLIYSNRALRSMLSANYATFLSKDCFFTIIDLPVTVTMLQVLNSYPEQFLLDRRSYFLRLTDFNGNEWSVIAVFIRGKEDRPNLLSWIAAPRNIESSAFSSQCLNSTCSVGNLGRNMRVLLGISFLSSSNPVDVSSVPHNIIDIVQFILKVFMFIPFQANVQFPERLLNSTFTVFRPMSTLEPFSTLSIVYIVLGTCIGFMVLLGFTCSNLRCMGYQCVRSRHSFCFGLKCSKISQDESENAVPNELRRKVMERDRIYVAREQERVERFQEASQSSLSALKLNIFNSSQSDPSCDQPEDKKWSLFVYDPDRIGRSASTEYRGPPSPLLSDSWRSNSNTDGMILSKSSNIASKQDACSSVVNDSLARGSKRFRLGSDRSVHVLRALKRKMPVSPRQLVLDAPSESHRVIALQSSSYPYSSYLPRLRESFVAEPLPDSDLQDDQDVSNSSLYVEKQNISHIIVDAHADQILPECSNISFSHNIKNPPAVAATTTSCNGAESTCHRVLDESSSSASHIRRLHSNSASPSLSISSAFHSISLTTLDNDSSSGTDSSLAQIFCDMPNIIDDNGTP